jgi:hypothetical protein
LSGLNKEVHIVVAALVIPWHTAQSSAHTKDVLLSEDDKYREIMFKSIAASSIRTALLELTQVPHIAGSKEDYDTAIYVKKVFGGCSSLVCLPFVLELMELLFT